MKKAIAVLGLSLMMVVPMLACASETTEVAPTGPDPSKEGVLVGVTEVAGMVVQLELEPSHSMWMFMSGSWVEMKEATGDLYHVEVKTIDPNSADRVSFAQVKFKAVNKDSGTVTEGMLHPMWGGSGLHYAFNSGLSGDGTYEATVTVEPPTLARSMSDKDKWMKTIVVFYHFKIVDGKVVEAEVHEH